MPIDEPDTRETERPNPTASRGRRRPRQPPGPRAQPALMLAAVKGLREVLPGDSRFGDTLSTGGEAQSQVDRPGGSPS